MTIVWIALLLGAGAMTLTVLRSWRHRVAMTELGSVSEQWLADQRSNDRPYSGR